MTQKLNVLNFGWIGPLIILLNFLFHEANSVASSLLLLDDCQSFGSRHEAQSTCHQIKWKIDF